MRVIPLTSVLVSILALAACGGRSAAPAGGGDTGPAGPAARGPLAAGEWDAMDHEARERFMEEVVVPAMAAEFKAFDPEEFGTFDCATCHRDGAADHSFEMPTAGLPSLSMDEIQNPDAAHKPWVDFMKTMTPNMAQLLGKPVASPENPQGFGCFNCHTMAQ